MKYQKVLSIISFVLVMLTLLAALISDFVLFQDAILQFIGGILASIFLFIILCIALLASIILVFGIFLIKEHGFWPLSVTISAFKEIIADIEITKEQISTFVSIRIVFLVICVITLVLSIIAKSKRNDQTKVPLKGMSIVTMVFSILGIVSAASLLVISLTTF